MTKDQQDMDAIGHVARLVKDCESYLDEQAGTRERALAYYNGEVAELPVETDDDGNPVRSSVVSKDVRDNLKKLMPSIMRQLLSNDKIVEYEPVRQEDEAGAELATDYVNLVVVPECGAEKALHDAVFDALVLKTGILKWVAYTRQKVMIQRFEDQADAEVLGLFDAPDIEVLDHEKVEETDPDVLDLDPTAKRHSFKTRQTVEETEVRMEAVPRGAFLITPGADSIKEAGLVGERQEPTRSELVERGYDKDLVVRLAATSGSGEDGDSDTSSRMGDDYTMQENDTRTALQNVKIYEVYVRIDLDGDGIAEMHKIVFGADGQADADDSKSPQHVVLEMEPVESAPYADVVAERDAHQFEGHSLFEDLEDIQRIKTSLIRNGLDNISWQNNPQPEVDLDIVEEPEAVIHPRFGNPIKKKPGTSGVPAVIWRTVPFVADTAINMFSQMDEIAKDRTGITDASGGLDPESLANVNSSVAQLAADSGVAQAEMIIRTLSRGGIREAFRGLLKLVIAHHNEPRPLRVNKTWQEYTPSDWNPDMKCKVNVGLGAGSRERDLAVLQMILALQKEIIAAFGPDNPYVKPDQLYRTMAKIAETAGFPSADPYFTKPDPQEVAAKLEAAKNQPDPAQMKMQMEAQLEQVKLAAQQKIEEAQMQADLAVKDAEQRGKLQIAELNAQIDLLKHSEKMALEYAKNGLIAPHLQQASAPDFVNV